MEHFSCTPSKHGRMQLEFRIDYPLRESDGNNSNEQSFYINAYFFTPYQLGINEARYSTKDFFADLVSYTRHKTVKMPLEKLTDPLNTLSPLTRINSYLGGVEAAGRANIKEVMYELRMLVNIFSSQVRDAWQAIDSACSGRTVPADEIMVWSENLLQNMSDILQAFRALRVRFQTGSLGPDVVKAYAWADELLSMKAERNYLRLFATLQNADILPDVRADCSARVSAETSYRKSYCYCTKVEAGNTSVNEEFLYRDSHLKKWAESALYMASYNNKSVGRARELLFGVAAAVAMFFALGVTYVAAVYGKYETNSFNWMVLAVLAYSFKDRLKDSLRALFLRYIPKLVADRMFNLFDPRSGTKVGYTRERVSYPEESEVAAPVRNFRYAKSKYAHLHDFTPSDNILHYSKEVSLKSGKLLSEHPRLSTLSEILRIDIHRWLYKMDKAASSLYYFDEDRLRSIKADRVYHLNVIMCLGRGHKNVAHSAMYHYRLVLSRKGILRVEEV